MAKQAGKLFFIEVGGAPSGSPPTVSYTNLASARSNDWTVNNTSVDVTAIDSAGMKELLEGAGITDLQLTSQMVFADSASEELVPSTSSGLVVTAIASLESSRSAPTSVLVLTTVKRLRT